MKVVVQRWAATRDGTFDMHDSRLIGTWRSDAFKTKRGRVQPRKLANALGGLPTMNWRQSRTRCNHFPITAERQFNYQIFEVILKLTKRLRSSLTDSSMDSISNVFKSGFFVITGEIFG
jgi:hypothetical protein